MTHEQIVETAKKSVSEVGKYKHLLEPYIHGNTIDIGSGGWPVVPWAIQIELPPEEYRVYTGGRVLEQAGVWRGDGRALPFKDRTVDTVFSSHLLEDFLEWEPILKEWVRVLRPGGHLVILVPDKGLWNAAVQRGQTPNCSHRHESHPGELSTYAARLGLDVIQDKLTALYPEDYSILFIARRR